MPNAKCLQVSFKMLTAEDKRIDVSFVDELVARVGGRRAALIGLLQAIQEHYRFLPREALERLCAVTEITPADVAGVSTFYNLFRHEPVGEHIIRVCHGTACHIKGAGVVTGVGRSGTPSCLS